MCKQHTVYQRGLVIDSQRERLRDYFLQVYQRGLVIDSQHGQLLGQIAASVSKGIGD